MAKTVAGQQREKEPSGDEFIDSWAKQEPKSEKLSSSRLVFLAGRDAERTSKARPVLTNPKSMNKEFQALTRTCHYCLKMCCVLINACGVQSTNNASGYFMILLSRLLEQYQCILPF
jgi:hypothetical protein